MQLVRASSPNGPSWGALEGDTIHLLRGEPWLGIREAGHAVLVDEVQLLAPTTPTKIVCVGQNYREHIAEMGYPDSSNPSVFLKPPSTLIGHGQAVVLPPTRLSSHVEHEAELGVVIGRPGRFITPSAALTHVLGYTCVNDVSARDLQRGDPYPTRGKGFDTFCPAGPWLETDIDLDRGLRIQCRVNGQTRQDGSTAQMIRDVPFIISFVSEFTTLMPGDLVLTGSPGGSGPLVAGDSVEIEVENIGTLTHAVEGPTRS